jgi:hypothetical protein
MSLLVENTIGQHEIVNIVDYIGNNCCNFWQCKTRKERKLKGVYLVGCELNTAEFCELILLPLINNAVAPLGFKVSSRKGFKLKRNSDTFHCTSGKKCSFNFSLYWDDEKTGWVLWASGSGNKNHSGHMLSTSDGGRRDRQAPYIPVLTVERNQLASTKSFAYILPIPGQQMTPFPTRAEDAVSVGTKKKPITKWSKFRLMKE